MWASGRVSRAMTGQIGDEQQQRKGSSDPHPLSDSRTFTSLSTSGGLGEPQLQHQQPRPVGSSSAGRRRAGAVPEVVDTSRADPHVESPQEGSEVFRGGADATSPLTTRRSSRNSLEGIDFTNIRAEDLPEVAEQVSSIAQVVVGADRGMRQAIDWLCA
jgi:hypothetical protein